MKKSILKYGSIVLGVLALIGFFFILIPIIVNSIIGSQNPTSIKVNGTAEGWHNFWAVYLGALFGASVPFIILFKTLKNNKIENEKNRTLQINTIAYQTEQQWINNLKTAIKEVYKAFSPIWFEELYMIFEDANDFNNAQNFQLVKNKIKLISDKINSATDNFRLTIIGKDDKEESTFREEFDNLRLRYCEVINDINILSSVCFHNGSDEMLMSRFKDTIKDYKDSCELTKDDSHRIWEIAEKYSMRLKTYKSKIVKDLTDAYEPLFFYEWCQNILEYECNKARNIINGT